MEEKNTNYMELSCQDFMEQLAGLALPSEHSSAR